MPEDRLLTDIVRGSKIETHIVGACTRHVICFSDHSARGRCLRSEQRWKRDALLGHGAHGAVYRERCENGTSKRLWSVKEIKKVTDLRRAQLWSMSLTCMQYSHCFVRSYGWFENKDLVFITMEYLESGLGFMYENGFVPRDLKPGSIMVATSGPDWFVKIADFGVSKRRRQDVTMLHSHLRGTFGFALTEALGFDDEKNGRSDAFAIDMWSLGAVTFKLLTNSLPFPSFPQSFEYFHELSRFPLGGLQARNLMSLALKARPSVAVATSHAWMQIALADVPEPHELA
ncbi:kinase-like domain-containing protein [Dactylonectria estremocensis]|uniref:Kinase-like domain-containing protein n=1 Tax=Dactylonectria estremocensis TaxID=1079267 RepID=A0A9P9F157_9HYPO|nr:kinase-like domain-containing protein [Dactylonectria estremocensis]